MIHHCWKILEPILGKFEHAGRIKNGVMGNALTGEEFGACCTSGSAGAVVLGRIRRYNTLALYCLRAGLPPELASGALARIRGFRFLASKTFKDVFTGTHHAVNGSPCSGEAGSDELRKKCGEESL